MLETCYYRFSLCFFFSNISFEGLKKLFLIEVELIRTSLLTQMVENPLAMEDTWVCSLGWEDSPGEGNGYSLQYSCLENYDIT